MEGAISNSSTELTSEKLCPPKPSPKFKTTKYSKRTSLESPGTYHSFWMCRWYHYCLFFFLFWTQSVREGYWTHNPEFSSRFCSAQCKSGQPAVESVDNSNIGTLSALLHRGLHNRLAIDNVCKFSVGEGSVLIETTFVRVILHQPLLLELCVLSSPCLCEFVRVMLCGSLYYLSSVHSPLFTQANLWEWPCPHSELIWRCWSDFSCCGGASPRS